VNSLVPWEKVAGLGWTDVRLDDWQRNEFFLFVKRGGRGGTTFLHRPSGSKSRKRRKTERSRLGELIGRTLLSGERAVDSIRLRGEKSKEWTKKKLASGKIEKILMIRLQEKR